MIGSNLQASGKETADHEEKKQEDSQPGFPGVVWKEYREAVIGGTKTDAT